MVRNSLLTAAVIAAMATPALAEDHPLFRPTRDVAVEYRSSGMARGPNGNPAETVTMRFSSKASRIRMEGANGRGYAIVDTGAGRMTMVMPEKQMYMELPADPGMVAMFHGANASFLKTGTATVAGIGCTTYDATANGRASQVCLTSDGVLLRATSNEAERGRTLEAVKVNYEEQPAALFEPPAGYQKMDMPAMPNGAPGGMPAGPGGRPLGPPGSMPGGPQTR